MKLNLQLKLFFVSIFLVLTNITNVLGSKHYGFIENKGQIINQYGQPNKDILFLLNAGNLKVQLKENGFSYELIKVTKQLQPKGEMNNNFEVNLPEPKPDSFIYTNHIHRIDFEFQQTNNNKIILKENIGTDYINYYTPHCGEQGILQVNHYGKIIYKNLYSGIDVEFLFEPKTGKPFKYNFILHEGADISQIKFKVKGAKSIEIANGSLVIETSNGKITETIPYSFTYTDNQLANKKEVKVEFKKLGNFYGFNLPGGSIEPNHTLVIDPAPWITYMGGAGNERSYGIAHDRFDNIYICGYTNSFTHIATSGSYQSVYAGATDVYINKYNKQGNIIWATYYGGLNYDYGFDMAIKGDYLFITGTTASDSIFSTTGSHQTQYGGGVTDLFLSCFNLNGHRNWGTYYGGNNADGSYGINVPSALSPVGNGITIDNDTNVIFCGTTYSQGLATPGTQKTFMSAEFDAILVKFNKTGTRLWATYHGGPFQCNGGGIDFGYGVAVDNAGFIYLTGYTNSGSFISTLGAYQYYSNPQCAIACGAYSSCNSFAILWGYIAKYSPNGLIHWGTYYGPNEQLVKAAVDDQANLFMVSSAGNLSKFDSSGKYLGAFWHNNNSPQTSLFIDKNNDVYVTGAGGTNQAGLMSGGTYQSRFGGGSSDGYITKFNNNLVKIWGTYIGGTQTDEALNVTILSDGSVVFTGISSSTNMATTGAQQDTLGGGTDAFIGLFKDTANTVFFNNIISSNQLICPGTFADTIFASIPNTIDSNFNFIWLESTTGPNVGFSPAFKNPTLYSKNFAPGIVSQNTWYRRLITAFGIYDTSNVVAVILKPKPTATFTVNDTSQCFASNQFVFTNNTNFSSGTFSNFWRFGQHASDTSTLLNAVKHYDSTGSFIVKLNTLGNNGCVDSFERVILVNPGFVSQNIISQPQQICNNGTPQLLNGNLFSGGAVGLYEDFNNSNLQSRGWKIEGTYNWYATHVNNPINSFNRPAPNGAIHTNGWMSIESPYFKPTELGTFFTFDGFRRYSNGRDYYNGAIDTLILLYDRGNGYEKIYMSQNWFCGVSTSAYFGYPSCWGEINIPLPVGTFRVKMEFYINRTPGDYWIDRFRLKNHYNSILWQQSIVSDTSGFVAASGINNEQNYQPPVLSQTTWYRRTVSNTVCFTDSGSNTIRVLVSQKPNPGFVFDSTAKCKNSTVIFTDTTTNITGRKWFFGSNPADTPTQQTVSRQFNQVGTQNIRLIADNNGCSETIQRTLRIADFPVASMVPLTPSLQVGTSIMFTNTSTVAAPDAIAASQWNFGDGTTSNNTTVTSKTYNTAGLYNIKLHTQSNVGCADSTSTFVGVYNMQGIGNNRIDSSHSFLISTAPQLLVGSWPIGGTNTFFEDFSHHNSNDSNWLPMGWQSNLHKPYLGGQSSYLRFDSLAGQIVSYNSPNGRYELTTLPFIASRAGDTIRFDVANRMSVFEPHPPPYVPPTYYGDSLIVWVRINNASNYIFLRGWGTKQFIDTLNGITTDLPEDVNFAPSPSSKWTTKSLALPNGTTQIKFEIIKNSRNGISLDRVTMDTARSYTFLWQQSFTGDPSSFTSATGINNRKDYQPPILSQPMWYRRVVTGYSVNNISNLVLLMPTFNGSIYFNKQGQPLEALSTWGTNYDGSGTSPTSFNFNNVAYIAHNNFPTIFSNNLIISGNNTFLALGTPNTLNTLSIQPTGILAVDSIIIRRKTSLDIKGSLITNKILTEETSNVSYSSTTPQNILPAKYFNLFTSNAQKNLIGNITITNNLFLNTHIQTNGYILALGESSSVPGNLVHQSGFISGKFKRYFRAQTNIGNNTGLFPFATNNNKSRSLLIEYNQAPTSGGSITAEFIQQNAGGSINVTDSTIPIQITTLNRLTNSGYWQLSADSITGGSFSMSANAENLPFVSSYLFLRLAWRIDSTQQNWGLQGNALFNGGDNNFVILRRTQIPNPRGQFIVASDVLYNALPAKLIDFKAKLQNHKNIKITWKTAQEINCSHFNLYRSYNTKNWEQIAKVTSNFNSNNINNYKFDDHTFETAKLNTNIYYRLETIDLDGTLEQSNIVWVNEEQNNDFGIEVYPNPFSDKIEITSTNEELQQFEIFDNTGKLVYSQHVNGNTAIIKPDENLAKGVYFLRVNNTTFKLIKQ
ncbi:MAG: PKD domain-containing protein [Bacteroidia bacterium]